MENRQRNSDEARGRRPRGAEPSPSREAAAGGRGDRARGDRGRDARGRGEQARAGRRAAEPPRGTRERGRREADGRRAAEGTRRAPEGRRGAEGRRAGDERRASEGRQPAGERGREAAGRATAADAVGALLASRRARIAAVAVVIALMAWGVASAVGSCSSTAAAARPTSADFVSHQTPDWADLHEEDGRMVYTVDGHVASTAGIDVSEHQGEIDWHAVAGDGIEFAIIRLGWRGAAEGEVREDACYARNLAGAREAGLDVGVYFFSQAIDEEEARAEADFVIEHLKGRELDYPVVYDHEPVEGVEGRADDLSVEQMTANAKAFCDRIDEAGYPAMIYGNAAGLARYSLADLPGYGIWFAEYGATIPSRLGRFSIWQYTDEGEVAGIGRTVDLNIRFPES